MKLMLRTSNAERWPAEDEWDEPRELPPMPDGSFVLDMRPVRWTFAQLIPAPDGET